MCHIKGMSDEPLIDSTPLEDGRRVIREFADDLPDRPGVYRMLSDEGDVLYVGKAKALKKRVMSYTHVGRLPIRLQRMVAQTRAMEFVYTHTEAEALLLEANLIKKLKPRFNILLRDDKSFPYMLLRADHDYPTVVKYRGVKQKKAGQYFGPFASAGDVNRTLIAMQKAFLLRNCTDGNFATRDRPCLQYHIKRCSAPCVDMVSRDEYAQQVEEARDFLEGRSDDVQERLRVRMDEASAGQDYEQAAVYRDRLKALVAVQARQDVNISGLGDMDVMALAQDDGGRSCVQVFFFRGGQNYGNQPYFLKAEVGVEAEDVMASFLAQFYLNKPVPKEVVVSVAPDQAEIVESALREISERAVTIVCPQRGQRRKLIEFAQMNAEQSLKRHVAERKSIVAQLKGVVELFDLDDMPQRIEVYDNSHISGAHMVGAMIVAGPDGFMKGAYRKFNIKEAGAADDYGMMREVMRRRFRKVVEEGAGAGDADWPDLLLIDGGKGQLGAVCEVLEEYGILDQLTVVAIAKGEDRNAGREQFFMHGREVFDLPVGDPVLHYLQIIRDEAHRYAVSSHRVRRKKAISSNVLDDVPGVGAKRNLRLFVILDRPRR